MILNNGQMNLIKFKIKINTRNIFHLFHFLFLLLFLSSILFIYFLSLWFFFFCSDNKKKTRERIDYTYSSFCFIYRMILKVMDKIISNRNSRLSRLGLQAIDIDDNDRKKKSPQIWCCCFS
jgi:hypothetical protein